MNSNPSRSKRSFSLQDLVWPGFVDALCALITIILFAFMVFLVSYMYLYQAVCQKEGSLQSLHKQLHYASQEKSQDHQQIQTLLLDLSNKDAEHSTQTQAFQDLKKLYYALEEDLHHQKLLLKAQNQHYEGKLSQAASALSSATKDVQQKEEKLSQLTIALEKALQEKVKELKNYRSEFFGKLRKALEHQKEIQVVGDRFIFSSEVLFDLGSATLGKEGKNRLAQFADVFKTVMKKIPKEIRWILRVDGHTDSHPVRQGGKFSSNLELSTARALRVVTFLISQGIPGNHLAAAGFGEFYPLVPGISTEKDRRIELILDQPKIVTKEESV